MTATIAFSYVRFSTRKQSEGDSDRRQTDLLERQNAARNLPQHAADVALFLEDRHAESRLIVVGETKVRAAAFAQFDLIAFGRDRFHQALCIVGGQYRFAEIP